MKTELEQILEQQLQRREKELTESYEKEKAYIEQLEKQEKAFIEQLSEMQIVYETNIKQILTDNETSNRVISNQLTTLTEMLQDIPDFQEALASIDSSSQTLQVLQENF